MKSSFKQWLDLNRKELTDWYCEGTMVDKDFLTRVEEFTEKACQAVYEDAYTQGWNDYHETYKHEF